MIALKVDNLTKTYPTGRGGSGKYFGALLGRQKPGIQAVRSITFQVRSGETLGVVGESGCGKSTLARMLVGLLPPTSGQIELEGKILDRSVKQVGKSVQYVFQDPVSSLNPRKTIRQILESPLRYLHKMDTTERNNRVLELLAAVNLRAEFLDRYPHEFSGGQAQRISIARALAASPRLLILDEPVSALDVSVQAQVLNLLNELKAKYDLTYLFISHDLAVVEAISDQVAVLYFGRIVELGAANDLFSHPKHPYTQLLANSAPKAGRQLPIKATASFELPDPSNPPSGCAFATRCNRATDQCRQQEPPLTQYGENQFVACYHPLEN